MIFLYLGPDEFSKAQKAEKAAAALGSRPVFFGEGEEIPEPAVLAGQDLFSQDKVFVLKNMFGKFLADNAWQRLMGTRNLIFFLEEKLDKRLAQAKAVLKDERIAKEEFALPHGQELDNWLMVRAGELGASLGREAAAELARRLGRDLSRETKAGGKIVAVDEVYNLWQAGAEIQKLAAYAAGKAITAADVGELVPENGEVDVFDLTNAIAENKKQLALSLLHKFLALQTGSEEKAAAIQLNALLAEQFRNVLMVQDFMDANKSETEILELTGWKSGRVFVMKKIAGRFAAEKVRDFLGKLKALDEELKTGSVPPKVLLDLITVQLL